MTSPERIPVSIGVGQVNELGIAEDRLVYVWRGAAAHEVDDVLKRDGYTHSAALQTTIAKVPEFNALEAANIDHLELYSCFPCVPKMARRRLGWPLDRPNSVYGGLTFGGGPIGNCMMHAAAVMVDKLRAGGSRGTGLIVANGGFATHNHAIVLQREAAAEIDLAGDYDVQRASNAMRGEVPDLLEDHVGPGRIESYVVPFDRQGAPSDATVIGRTESDAHFVAYVPADDRPTLAVLMADGPSPIGGAGSVARAADGRGRWTSKIL